MACGVKQRQRGNGSAVLTLVGRAVEHPSAALRWLELARPVRHRESCSRALWMAEVSDDYPQQFWLGASRHTERLEISAKDIQHLGLEVLTDEPAGRQARRFKGLLVRHDDPISTAALRLIERQVGGLEEFFR